MEGAYTQATWRRAYGEMMTALGEYGIPEEVGKYIARNLRRERAIRRMTGYLRAAHPGSMEEIADEMLAIMEDSDRWRRQREAQESNARYNAWLRSDLRGQED